MRPFCGIPNVFIDPTVVRVGSPCSRLFLGLILTLCIFTLTAPAVAGSLHERLVDEMSRTPSGAGVRGLVTMSQQIDFPALEREMAARGIKGRAERHEYVVRTAQDLARDSQRDLRGWLDAATASGRVRSYQAFWVTNTIAVDGEPSVFSALSLRRDTGMIYAMEPVIPRFGEDAAALPETRVGPARAGEAPATLNDNFVAVNVEPAWEAGYTGAGRLVCDFDSGADGNHPAFASRWRGLDPDVSWFDAWKDPWGHTHFPYDSQTHGTHTLGIMVAHPPGGDPLGIAYEAKWIAAGVLIHPDFQLTLECYEWAIDPDGDPTTIADVPDVINNSWGSSANCDQTFWNAIDLVEAAGIVNTIAVDNTGPNPMTVNSPESRATSPYQNFGIGNVNPHDDGYPIYYLSGRGPSPCDSVSIKPEMTAPGVLIYSTLPNDHYGSKTGCSMACPHVSGAVAILRQVNPELTVEQIKDVLMQTASDRGEPGEDNDYGWGILDVGAAVNFVIQNFPPSPPPHDLARVNDPHSLTLELAWQRPVGIVPTNPLTGYRLFAADSLRQYPSEALAEFDSTVTSYTTVLDSIGTHYYVVTATYADSTESRRSNELRVTAGELAAVGGRPSTGVALRLAASPNPFNEHTEFRLSAPVGSGAKIEIFDASGRIVRTLDPPEPTTGVTHPYPWDGRDDAGRSLPAGAYFARAMAGSRPLASRVILVH